LDAQFREAVAEFLKREGRHVLLEKTELEKKSPFRKIEINDSQTDKIFS
jgi:predicted N-acyltransferase